MLRVQITGTNLQKHSQFLCGSNLSWNQVPTPTLEYRDQEGNLHSVEKTEENFKMIKDNKFTLII